MFQPTKAFIRFILDLLQNRQLIAQLTVRDCKSQYFGSYLGLLWAFVQPTVTIFIFWFVFDVGFKSAPVNDYPFLLWLVVGMVPWFYVSDGISTGVNSIASNAIMVQKIVFRVSMLPLVKVFSSLVIHLFFIVIVFILCLLYGVKITFCTLQVVYYLLCATILIAGLNWLTSSIVVFFKDLGPFISMMLQFTFWLTPIFWSIDMIPEKFHIFVMANPVHYIISGYRDCFIHNIWFWQHPGYTLYYWSLTGLAFISGAIVFSRLRPHFADVL
jgi:lipopolysaccharide transport system permease protein/teichoic acid transport system permease protein